MNHVTILMNFIFDHVKSEKFNNIKQLYCFLLKMNPAADLSGSAMPIYLKQIYGMIYTVL